MGERDQFLMNPFGLLYSEVTASSLVRVNNEGDILDPGSTQLGINRRGFDLHSTIYGARRDVKCVMHLHTVAGVAVSASHTRTQTECVISTLGCTYRYP